MSQSNLQVLLHAGELCQIVHAIQQSNGSFVGGCLFGLWRNSLKQPVIQFVTGPGKRFKKNSTVESVFDSEYNRKCKKIMWEKHAMLKLGYWFSGSKDERDQVYELFGHSNEHVLLFVYLSEQELRGEYFLKVGSEEDHGSLCKEDVLAGNSSFRLYYPLTKAINDDAGAKYASRSEENEIRLLSSLIENFPSRVEVRDPETRKEQWYSGEEGVNLLQSLVQCMNSASIQVDMSRDATTHNLQFNLNGGYCLDFPPNFPKRMPLLSDSHGNPIHLDYQYRNDVDICRTVVDAVRSRLQRRSGRSNR